VPSNLFRLKLKIVFFGAVQGHSPQSLIIAHFLGGSKKWAIASDSQLIKVVS
jgi:hypothetical protein